MGLLLLSFRAPLGSFAFSRTICLFYGPMIHYSYRLGLMTFLSNYQLISTHVAGLLPFTGLPKMSHQQGLPTKYSRNILFCYFVIPALPSLYPHYIYPHYPHIVRSVFQKENSSIHT